MRRFIFLAGVFVVLESSCVAQTPQVPPPGPRDDDYKEPPFDSPDYNPAPGSPGYKEPPEWRKFPRPIPFPKNFKPPTKEEAEKQMRALEDRWMTDAMPSDWATYKKEFAGNFGESDARAAVRLMLAARQLRAEAPPRTEASRKLGVAYRTAWQLCIRAFKNSKDPAARKVILDEWNKLLRKDGKFMVGQVIALEIDWDPAFLTDDFWRLVGRSRDKNTLVAVCFVMIPHGSKEDYERLGKKQASLDVRQDHELVAILGYTRYRMTGRLFSGGTASQYVRPLPRVEE